MKKKMVFMIPNTHDAFNMAQFLLRWTPYPDAEIWP
jgi:hypothetical protein